MLGSKQHILGGRTIERRLLLTDGLLGLVAHKCFTLAYLGDALEHFKREFLVVDLDI